MEQGGDIPSVFSRFCDLSQVGLHAVIHCTVLHCTALRYTELHFIALH